MDITSGQRSETVWAVHRQDDNGNAFVVERGLTRERALQLVAEFESRGHKQLYWLTPEDPSLQENT